MNADQITSLVVMPAVIGIIAGGIFGIMLAYINRK